jgi:lysozyme
MHPVSRLRLSDRGFDVLHEREGLRLEAYFDTVADPPVWTICLGHTSAAGPPEVYEGMTGTEDECEAIFIDDCETFARECRGLVKVPLEQWHLDALASFVYNIGSSGFAGSTVLRELNAGNYQAAGEAMMLWNKPSEIITRRRGESLQFLEGRYDARIDENGNAC